MLIRTKNGTLTHNIRLTESDLTNLVNKIVLKQSNDIVMFLRRRSDLIDNLIEKNIDEF